jgi:hypothetical protein
MVLFHRSRSSLLVFDSLQFGSHVGLLLLQQRLALCLQLPPHYRLQTLMICNL